jgi:hypothetical protein
MSSNFNQAKVINVYYNKGDRKPYDITGKPIAYIGEEGIGATEATTIRFYLGEDIDSSTAVIVTKRPDGERRLDLCEKFGTGANSYYEVTLNEWYGAVKGKATIAFKVYNGTVTFDDNENPTEIVTVSGRIIVSDIFNLEIRYAPEADLVVPPDDSLPYQQWFFALSTKLDKADSITVAGALPDPLTGYDDRYFYIENEGEGKLYYIDGSTAEEVVWGIGTLKLTSNGNSDINVGTNAGKMYWDEDRGTIIGGLYDDQETGVGDTVFFFGKATETISKGEVVQFDGNVGGNINFKKAVFSEISAQPDLLMGVAKHDIPSGDFGYVIWFGYVRNLNTDTFATPILYLSTTTPGALSSTKPTSGFKGSIAAVARPSNVGSSNGFLIVRPNLVKNINDLSNVTINTIVGGQILRYNSTNSRWENSGALTTLENNFEQYKVDIASGAEIVGNAFNDQFGDQIDTTYLKVATASSTYIPLSSKGQANGVAPLGPDNKILSIHLPGGVDDIKEFADLASFPLVGEASIIYVALDTNKIYRWGGSSYVEISSSLALGTTNTTAFPGDRGLATETKTDNIVSGDQTLSDTKITNSTNSLVPLTINAVSGSSTLQEWKLNNNLQAYITGGRLRTVEGVANITSSNNAYVNVPSTGTIISRNIADANPSLIVNQANAGSTGDILRLQSAGANKLEITKDGFINQNGTRLFSQPVNNQNTFFGASSGGTNTTGSLNTGFGDRSLNALTTGTENTGFGRLSLFTLTTGSENTAIGESAGRSITTGSNNTFLGDTAGSNASQLVSATNSTALGFGSYTDASNQMVFGNASVTQFKFDRNSGAVLLAPQITASSANASVLERTSSGTNSALNPLIVKQTTSGDMVDGFGTDITFQIRDNANVDNSIAIIRALRTGADNSGRLAFRTSTTGTSTEKMTILNDGKVGIGTSAPARLLSLVTSANDDGLNIRRNSNTTNEYSTLSFRIATTDSETPFAQIRATRTSRSTSTDTDISFFSLSGGSLTEKMRIRDDGLVGINETSPSAQLQIKSGATTRVPLIVDTIASNTADLQVWRNEGNLVGFVNRFGNFGINGMFNVNSSSNSFVSVATTGTTISRNINDTNPALIVNLANASSNANIQVWQKAGVAQSWVNGLGEIVTGALLNKTSFQNALITLGNTGTTIARDVNDANVALKINQQQGTGKIVSFQFGAVEKAYVEIDGDIYNTNGTYGTISDERIKENIIDARNYTEDLMKLRVVKYSLKDEMSKEPTHLGFIAQEVEQVFPKMVSTTKRGDIQDFKQLKTSVLIPMLVKTIQELNKRIEELEKK